MLAFLSIKVVCFFLLHKAICQHYHSVPPPPRIATEQMKNRSFVCPAGSEYDEEEADYEESDSDESWTTESAISSESILSSMCMNGGDEKPFACPVPGCKKRYKVRNKICILL